MNLYKYLLDSNIISKLIHPKHPNNKDIGEWFISFVNKNGQEIYLSQIVAYEIRRGLLVKKLKDSACKSLERYEQFANHLTFLPINTRTFRIAEKLWAEARINGYPTAGDNSLDCDVLIAAQAIEISASIITENIKHLKNYVPTHHWKELIS